MSGLTGSYFIAHARGQAKPQTRDSFPACTDGDPGKAAPTVADKFVSHGEQRISKNQPFKNERVGHPQEQKQFLGVDVLEWYHPPVRVHPEKKREGIATRLYYCDTRSEGVVTCQN